MLHCRLTSGFEGRVLSLAKVKKTGKRKSLPLLRPSLCFRRIKDKRGQLAAPVLKAEKILTEKMEITALLSSEKEHPL
ncbi:RAN binding protein 3 [Homo sapiens]|uniref:RAN binding protein 3 n=1 Tax=Homo sapiens TaxID=9606 RepID=K7ERD4_HUMAN|nr:RAN binding protein 3 [Homo sapiens]KAI4039848.1 RAN binding protein 3 [Homo sapiens]